MEYIDTLEFGAEIAVDGMPAWLRDDEQVMAAWGNVWFSGGATWVHCYADPTGITAIRLPADHWTYPVIAAGFEPWGGGDEAPGDAGEVMLRNGEINPESPFYRWGHAGDGNHFAPEYDIIGYKRKVAPGSEVWSAATVYEPGDVVRVEIPADTVTIPTMTEEEAREKAEAHCEDYEWDNGYIQALRDLGLIRPTTLLDQFEAHHGGLDDNQRAIIEIYQEWIAAQ